MFVYIIAQMFYCDKRLLLRDFVPLFCHGADNSRGNDDPVGGSRRCLTEYTLPLYFTFGVFRAAYHPVRYSPLSPPHRHLPRLWK